MFLDAFFVPLCIFLHIDNVLASIKMCTFAIYQIEKKNIGKLQRESDALYGGILQKRAALEAHYKRTHNRTLCSARCQRLDCTKLRTFLMCS